MRRDDEGRDQRACRRAEIAAELKQRLRETMLAARGHAGDARCFRMKDRGADADERRAAEQHDIMLREGEQQQSAEREGHADRQRIGARIAVRIEADEGLQKGAGELEGERDQPDLAEVEPKRGFDDRIDGRQERLNRIVQKMREAQRHQHGEKHSVARIGRDTVLRLSLPSLIWARSSKGARNQSILSRARLCMR